ncbi:transporter substrate-binding domain-containing protein [Candidatus Gracilibacteria bacterium]|nr:transporter substrate-binding domain-containing protein [Candidatus Gracilibacteria bacterium]
MFRNIIISTFLILAGSFIFTTDVFSQRELNIATRISPPIVDHSDNKYTGYSIDIWNEVAKRNDYQTNWIQKNSIQELIDSVKNKEVDASIASISQTPSREEVVDFSNPYLDSGLQIISQKNTNSIFDLFKIFLNSGAVKILIVGVILILLVAHIYWITKRITTPKFPKNYFFGIWEGIWWGSVGLFQADYGEERPGSRRGQFVLIIWLFISLVFLAQLEAVVTAEYTIDRLESRVSTLSDIISLKVGVVEGTTSQIYASEQNLNTVSYNNAQEMLNAVRDGQIKAGISDAPIVQFYKNHEGSGLVETGEVLQRETYAIAFSIGSPLRKEINKTLLEMEGDGTLKKFNKNGSQ